MKREITQEEKELKRQLRQEFFVAFFPEFMMIMVFSIAIIGLIFVLRYASTLSQKEQAQPDYYADYTVVERFSERPFLTMQHYLVVEDKDGNRYTVTASAGTYYTYQEGSELSCHLMHGLHGTYEILSLEEQDKK